jgi:Na+/melibiose symporter-like transporter
VNSGLNLILFALSCVSSILLVALLVWEVAKYRSTGHRIQMLRQEIERNRRERKRSLKEANQKEL